ncbi:hypothetical protein MCAP1_000888 [Malassezia caprae]|uniref:Uncharacterized protein n=1 Tax=Malassezia caprae TaxID=1381934 RepID=A0AAF0IUG6_9BASI|nr:hypothetical protein MCAP1_000888 [Malassezia caprae]
MFKANKGPHYARELHNARLRGLAFWHSDPAPDTPADRAGVAPESRSAPADAFHTLLRKFSKHNPQSFTTARIAAIEHDMHRHMSDFLHAQGFRDGSHANDGPGGAALPPVMDADATSAQQVQGLITELQSISRTTDDGSYDATACVALSALGLFLLGRDEDMTQLIAYTHLLQMDPITGAATQEHHVALVMMGAALYGMAQERTGADMDAALEGYGYAIRQHERVRGGAASKAARTMPFVDEIERWVETALYRSALLTLRLRGTTAGVEALRVYQAHETRWPSWFCLTQRNVLRSLHADLLNQQRSAAPDAGAPGVVRAPDATGPRTTSTRRPHGTVPAAAPPSWSAEYAKLKASAAQLVQATPSFPHVNESNARAERLAEQLVESWRLDGAHDVQGADDVVQILYGFTRITYRSATILRLLVRMLVAAEAYAEAGSLVDKYRKLVETTWEASGRPAQRDTSGVRAVDGPLEFIDTLLLGAMVHLRYLRQPQEALSLTDALLVLVQEADAAVPPAAAARVWRVGAEVRVSLVAVALPAERATYLSEAQQALEKAVSLDAEAAEAFWALGYVHALARHVDAATTAVRRAIELEPAWVEAWHLLVLLLTAQKDFAGARRLAAEALSRIEADDEADMIPAGKAPRPPSARTQLVSLDYPPTPFERACTYMRLLMTHNSLLELTEGVPSALEDQRDLFTAFQVLITPLSTVPTTANDTARAPEFVQPPAAALAASPAEARIAFRARVATRLLQSLWLQSAATFRRGDDFVQARSAIAEAEQLDTRLADVWVQLALWCRAAGSPAESAITCLYKALACETDHVAASVHLARVLLDASEELPLRASHAASLSTVSAAPENADALMELALVDAQGPLSMASAEARARASGSRSLGSADMPVALPDVSPAFQWRTDATLSTVGLAEGLLRTATLGRGWDVPEAWHALAQLAQSTGRPQNVLRRTLLEALRLEATRPVRAWHETLRVGLP